MSGALGRVVGTTLALWLPLLPLFLFVRHAISSRTPSRCAPVPYHGQALLSAGLHAGSQGLVRHHVVLLGVPYVPLHARLALRAHKCDVTSFWLDRNAVHACARRRAKKGGASKAASPPVTFRDVAGLDTAKEELLEVVACLRDARRYARLNAKTPSGVLLTGPPGTGKTLLGARALCSCTAWLDLPVLLCPC
jgi:hypothetical protein